MQLIVWVCQRQLILVVHLYEVVPQYVLLFIVQRIIGDKAGEAKASGNLGNTLKLLGKFDEAAACCQRQFDIYKDLSDSVSAYIFQAGCICFVSY